jgi:hypothetical protein
VNRINQSCGLFPNPKTPYQVDRERTGAAAHLWLVRREVGIVDNVVEDGAQGAADQVKPGPNSGP